MFSEGVSWDTVHPVPATGQRDVQKSMKRFKADSGPRAPSGALLGMWRGLLQGTWRSLVVVPVTAEFSARPVLGALEDLRVGGIRFIDGEGTSAADGLRLAEELSGPDGRRVALLDSPVMSLAAIPAPQAADAILLVMKSGAASTATVADTIAMVDRRRVLGSVAVSPPT